LQCEGGQDAPLAVVDYAHTPDALQKTLDALRPLAQQRGGLLWCVFGCGGDRDNAKRPLMGAIAAAKADRLVITNDNPRFEKPSTIVSHILAGMGGAHNVEVQMDRAQAIAHCLARASAADVVLIAGKGHEASQETAGEKIVFSDLAHARHALAERSSQGATA
jgi:UDP-N-acetylmuramoyl-L-alanyl-D-glutamate--2,6-diaminopimelate ligase